MTWRMQLAQGACDIPSLFLSGLAVPPLGMLPDFQPRIQPPAPPR